MFYLNDRVGLIKKQLFLHSEKNAIKSTAFLPKACLSSI